MPPIVRLEDIVDALELPDEWEVLLDPDTGKIVTMHHASQPRSYPSAP